MSGRSYLGIDTKTTVKNSAIMLSSANVFAKKFLGFLFLYDESKKVKRGNILRNLILSVGLPPIIVIDKNFDMQ